MNYLGLTKSGFPKDIMDEAGATHTFPEWVGPWAEQ